MSRVVHFEIPVDDPERAGKFYANAFGWQIGSWGGPADYWICSTGAQDAPGIDGALTRRSSMYAPVHVGVTSVDEALEKVRGAGGEVLSPKSAIPGVGCAAYCRDSEGNSIGIFEADPGAA
jgi:uncharacterized protein